MDERVHDSLHLVAMKTKAVNDALKDWEEEVSKLYILIDDLCKERPVKND